MSDESQAQASSVLENATHALETKQISTKIDKLKKQVLILWIVVAVVAVIALVGAGMTLFGRSGGGGQMPTGARTGTTGTQQQSTGSGTGATTGQ
jgi:beta-lactamase regulating signal transducer with metallopeptidase domain